MNNIRITTSIICLIGIISCIKLENQNKSIHFPVGSKWTFIKETKKIEANYAEIEFYKNNRLIIHSETDGQIGPIQYNESDNKLMFNKVDYLIISNPEGSIVLKSPNEEFLLYKIPFEGNNLVANQIDPFYLRRCYFLVNLNYITTDDAIKYLSDIDVISQDSIPEEEIILSNQK